MKLDVIIPIFNNEKQILNFYNKVNEDFKDIKHTFIFVDDSSTDKSLDIINNIKQNDDENVKILTMSKSFGLDICIYSGLQHSNGDLVCICDNNYLSNPNFVKKMYDYIINHDEIDQVCMYSNYPMNKMIKLFNKIYKLNVDINKTYFRIMKRNVVLGVLRISQKYSFTNYSFELIGFNTYYMKFDAKNKDNKIKLSRYIKYSNKPFKLIKYYNYLQLIVLLILALLMILKKITISTNILLILIIVLSIFNIIINKYMIYYIIKKECNNIYILKDKIGFEENIL